MIPQQQIDRIKQEANDDIVAVVEKYVKLKRSGNSYKGLCPFHDENTPSFSVSERRQMYKCFGCDEGGDAVDFVMKMEGMDFIEAIRHLAGMLGIIITEEETKKPKDYTPPNAVIPGIREAKRHIRKAERAIICFSDDILQELKESGRLNAVLVKQWGSKQAQLLAKYTDDITIICRGLLQKKLFQSLAVAARQNLSVNVAITPKDDPQHWTQFIIQHFPPTNDIRSACIKIIAQIPDGIFRATETQYLAKNWDKSNDKQ